MQIKAINLEWHPDLPIFAAEGYLRTISDEYGWMGGYHNGELTFILPYAIRKKWFFRQLEFQTTPIFLGENYSVEQEGEFLGQIVKYLAKTGIDAVKQPPNHAIFAAVPDEAVAAEFGSYILDLAPCEQDLWAIVDSKHRNVIRRAEKGLIKISRGSEHAEAAYKLIKRTMDRSNMFFYGESEYQKLLQSLGAYAEIFIATKDDEPQGCAVFPYSRYSAYYLLGGSADAPFLGAVNLLHWEAIKYFKAKGVRQLDYVGARLKPAPGSRQEGIQRFKSRFGATLRAGYLWKMDYSPVKMGLYRLLAAARHGRKGDIIDQERKRVQNNSTDF